MRGLGIWRSGIEPDDTEIERGSVREVGQFSRFPLISHSACVVRRPSSSSGTLFRFHCWGNVHSPECVSGLAETTIHQLFSSASVCHDLSNLKFCSNLSSTGIVVVRLRKLGIFLRILARKFVSLAQQNKP